MEIEISKKDTGEVVDRFACAAPLHEAEWSVTIQRATLERTPPEEVWEASLPFRGVSAVAATEAAAVGGLVRVYAEMSRSGRFNPARPHEKGEPMIQHVIGVLTDHLRDLVDGRGHFADEDEDVRGALPGPEVLRRSESIAAVATAIAALGRVKGL